MKGITEKFILRIAILDIHYQTAKSWISQFATPLPTLDALHLPITSTHDLTLLTADPQFAEAAEYFGINAHTFSNLSAPLSKVVVFN